MTSAPQGGSEIVFNTILNNVDPNYWEKINLILSSCDPNQIVPNKKNILLQQLSYDQPLVQNISDPDYLNRIDCIVFVSHWSYEKFHKIHQVPAYKSVIIPNATHRTAYQPRRNSIKRLVYTSTPWRGLETLLRCVSMLDRQDFHLDVFSSTKIYGQQFFESEDQHYQNLWDQCNADPRITLHGHQSNDTVRSALQTADIFAYPNTWEETFCISALEAAIAGCQLITTSHGALPEICGPWAKYVPYGENLDILALRYAHELNRALNSGPYDGRAQSEFYNRHYTWDQVIPQWENLFNNVLEDG